MAGCGGEDDENDVDTLYEELVGKYELFRGELAFSDGRELVLEPPDIAGSMTITSDSRITQNLKVYGKSTVLTATFELFPDEGIIEMSRADVTSRATYTWNGSVFTTTVDVGTFIEKDFWRKL